MKHIFIHIAYCKQRWNTNSYTLQTEIKHIFIHIANRDETHIHTHSKQPPAAFIIPNTHLIFLKFFKLPLTYFNMSILGSNWVRAARTRAPSATNYDVYASRRKILKSPGPKCNGAGSSRPSTFRIMDSPRPGKWVPHCSEGSCTSDLPVFCPTLWVFQGRAQKSQELDPNSQICAALTDMHYAPWTLPISTGKPLNNSCCWI
jgi:hypothetical protein